MKKYVRKGLRILGWTIGIIIILLLILLIAIQIPAVQNLIKDEAVSYLEGKIKTKVVVDNLEISFPKKVLLEGVYLEDQNKDTLLYGKKLAVNINLFDLLSNKVEINSIDLEHIVANVSRNDQSEFNFDYIIKAFDSGETKKDSSAPMQISIGKINLDKIRLKYDDAITKNDISLNLHHFDTKIKTFDLENLNFEIPKITLDGLAVKLKQGIVEQLAQQTEEVVEEQSKNPTLTLKLGEIDLSRINLGYENEASKMVTENSLEKLLVKFNSIDIEKQNIDIQSLAINNIKSSVVFGKLNNRPKETIKDTVQIAKEDNNWKVKLNRADLKQIAFYFDDANSAPLKKGIDYKHLDLKDLNLDAQNLAYSTTTISGNLNNFKVKDKSGVDIQNLQTDFFYGEKGASLKNLYLKTPQTEIKDEIIIGYTSLDSISQNIGDLEVNASIEGSKIGFKDVLLFVPTLADTNPFKSNPNAILHINSEVSGKVSDITIPNLEIYGIGKTKLNASGRITGLPDVKTAYLDINLNNFESSAKDLNDFVPSGTIPKNFQLPASFRARGTFKGTLDNFNTDMNLATSSGNAKVKASFDSRRKNYERYDAIASLDNFDVGRLLRNDSIGKVSLKAKVKGTGLDPKTANAVVDAQLIKAGFNGYTYKNLDLKGNIKGGNFKAVADMNDPNLTFGLDAEGGFNGKYPEAKVRLNVDIADLEKLNLHAGPLKLKGNIDADIETADIDYLNGTLNAYKFTIANANEQFVLDTISVVAIANAEKDSIGLKSQFVNASIDGKYKLSQLATALQNSIAKYYDTNPSAKKIKTDAQQVAFNIDIKSDPILMKIVPTLKSLEPITISGRYNSVNDTIILKGRIPKVVYGTNTITNAVIDVKTENDSLLYNVVVDDIESGKMRLPYTRLSGGVNDNVVAYDLLLRDLADKDQYAISGKLEATKDNTEISLNPDGLLLNYQEWNLPATNKLAFGKDGILADNFELSNEGSSLKIQSETNTPNAPIAVDFTDFKIETLTNIVQMDSLQVAGVLQGNVLLKDLKNNMVFTSDLNIENFSFRKDTLGNINIKVDNQTANTFTAKVAITGQENEVNLDGTYRSDNSSFDLNLDIAKLNMKSIQGFTMGNLAESTGFLDGQFKITGTASQPNVNGDLNFNDVGFKVTQLNSKFKSINDKITIDGNGLNFRTFTITDENNNKLVLKGSVLTKTFTDFGFNLDIEADNFKAVNSGAKDNDVYYGELFLDTRLKVRGDLNKPVVEGNIKINEDTKFTIVLPQSDPSIVDREGIIEFIDQDNPPMITKVAVNDSLSKTQFKGIDASVNIEIDKEAELSIIIDKGNGDYLKLKGEARLTGGIDPSGKTSLTGRYEFTEGSYEMTFSAIKRKFDIKKGSYILWTGEPTSADVSITAVYKVDAAPIDLLQATQTTDATYRQRIEFETELKMNGELLKPEITFDIVLPDGNNNVSTNIINATQTRLAQLRQEPSELNKQVFALLLLNRFVGENPFASEAGSGGAESMVRQSASKILSQQMNNFAGDLISGVELNFDLESTDDYTTGQRENRTDLNVAVSKRLLDDRLKVTVGSSFGLEGPQQANEETTNIAGDVALDYQLTKDGRYMVRAYRKNQYQVALQGQVVETGVGFIITMDYNKFRELFHRSQEEKDLRAKEKQEKKEKKEKEEKRAKEEALKNKSDEQ
ncbi:translocation/assembly module TamB domain-containing protein [Flavobacterium soli]|uniref:translocation/assembly module TamB domain-containing protein n=1 Tax=Flavobacterium soli TaxID=344881 RepID=UPI00047BD379|nr:translocation/assembly module TamB [Flavobacterium soli]